MGLFESKPEKKVVLKIWKPKRLFKAACELNKRVPEQFKVTFDEYTTPNQSTASLLKLFYTLLEKFNECLQTPHVLSNDPHSKITVLKRELMKISLALESKGVKISDLTD
jgi:hypothetical protein